MSISEILTSILEILSIPIILIIVFALVILCYAFYAYNRPALRDSAPTILTTLGIFGTFVGIFIGLWDFEVAKISKSIPQLLGGLQFAFATSIVGMVCAFGFRSVRWLRSGEEEGKRPEGGVGADDIYDALRDLRTSIAGDSDDSLLSQFKNLRTDINDGNKKLIEEFQNFAEKMADTNSQALIDALKDVMRDFNAKINEQFGDNFKQLNEAVGRLLEWQENYRLQMETLGERIVKITEELEKTAQYLEQIVDKSSALPEILDALPTTLQNAQSVIEITRQQLQGFAEIADTAKGAFPIIEDNITKMTSGVEAVVDRFVKKSDEALEEQVQAIEQLRNSIKGAFAIIEDNIAKITSGVEAAVDQFVEKSEEALEEQNRTIQQLRNSIEDTHKSLAKEMEDALAEAITELGQRLTSLSSALADEYGNLIKVLNQMQKISGKRK